MDLPSITIVAPCVTLSAYTPCPYISRLRQTRLDPHPPPLSPAGSPQRIEIPAHGRETGQQLPAEMARLNRALRVAANTPIPRRRIRSHRSFPRRAVGFRACSTKRGPISPIVSTKGRLSTRIRTWRASASTEVRLPPPRNSKLVLSLENKISGLLIQDAKCP